MDTLPVSSGFDIASYNAAIDDAVDIAKSMYNERNSIAHAIEASRKPAPASSTWPTHCIHGRPIPAEGEAGWCPDCKAANLAASTAPGGESDTELDRIKRIVSDQRELHGDPAACLNFEDFDTLMDIIEAQRALIRLRKALSSPSPQPSGERAAISPSIWDNGKRRPGTLQEFTQQLRRYSGWADEEFKILSSPAAHLGERLNVAADVIDALAPATPDSKARG